MTPTQVVGQRIAQARKDRGIRQDELGGRLAEYLGKPWTKQAVSETERGNRHLDPTEFLAFTIVLDYPVAWFFLPPAGQPFRFPGRIVPLGEVADGPLLAPSDVRQALVEEQMAVMERLRVEIDCGTSKLVAFAQTVTPTGIPSSAVVGEPTLAQEEPK
jgi:transcriptional regulator with XRE-family HTH domain